MKYADFGCSRNVGPITDEVIRIKFAADTDGPSQVVEIWRSDLMKSPTLNNIICSSHYLEGCEMIISFLNDTAACFVILKEYLEEPARYDCTRLRVHMFIRHKVCVDKFLIQTSLYLLAKKLRLPGLVEIVYECLQSLERLVSPSVTVTMTELIFSAESKFDRLMKDWCMKHVGINYAVLHMSDEWAAIVPRLDLEFQAKWAQLVDANLSIMTAIEERHDEDTLKEMIVRMDQSQLGSVVSAIEHLISDMGVEEILALVGREDADGESKEDVEPQNLTEEKTVGDTKEKAKPGLYKVSRKSRPWSKSYVPLPETTSAKAKELMGLNQDAEIKAKKSATRKSRRFPRFLR